MPVSLCGGVPDGLHGLFGDTCREVALLGSDTLGAQSFLGQARSRPARYRAADRTLCRDLLETSSLPGMVLDPRPGIHIVDMNAAYVAATLSDSRRACGSKLFEVFPDNPEMPDADGISNLYESLRTAVESGQCHAMAVQRYDVCNAAGVFVEKHWQPTNTPIYDEYGQLVFILHQAIDVTAQVLSRRGRLAAAF